MREKVENIIGHGINCFVNRQLIYNFPEEIFADAGIMAIEHADFDGIERLALVTGPQISDTKLKAERSAQFLIQDRSPVDLAPRFAPVSYQFLNHDAFEGTNTMSVSLRCDETGASLP